MTEKWWDDDPPPPGCFWMGADSIIALAHWYALTVNKPRKRA